MDALKTVVAALVALSVGAVGGGFAVYRNIGVRDSARAAENARLVERIRALEADTESLRLQAGEYERDAQAREAELRRLESEPRAEPAEAEAWTEEGVSSGTDSASAAARPSRGPGRAGAVPGDAALRAERVEPSAEQLEQSRAEYTQRLRERMQSYVDTEAQKTTDPVVQQRLAMLREQADYMVEMLQAVRSATDDAQRADFQQQFNDARANVQALVQEQQDYMLRQVAAQHGITDPQRQQAFVESLRQA